MNLYVGDYWAPFPSSEYGGMWVVIAENENQCIDILCGLRYDDEHESDIRDAVAKAKYFELNPEQNYLPSVADYFFT
jgi:hypothetical protein